MKLFNMIFNAAIMMALMASPRAYAQIADDPESQDNFGQSVAIGDFNGDGKDDLAIGVPRESIGPINFAGAVNVIYGSSGAGLAVTGNQFWHQNQPGIEGASEADDNFGESLASGDFDGDGYDDLAIGVPSENIGSISNAGAVNVLYGSSTGLTATGNEVWHQNQPGIEGTAEEGDDFGESLASGDFDGDGYDDLAIGVLFESIGSIDAGAVNVIYGSSSGLTAAGNQMWHQNQPGIEDEAEYNDQFGNDLTSGDFDGDGYDDLAIGVVHENSGGAVNVLYGSWGVGLSATGNQIWHQDQPNIEGSLEGDDNFGTSLASGDFNGDGFNDLAIGVSGEDINSLYFVGVVSIIYGSAAGLTSSGDQIWHQDKANVEGVAESYDYFGSSLTSGDFNGDSFNDLAIGTSHEKVGSISSGAVNVLYGSATGLTSSGDQLWHQDKAGIEGTADNLDFFGYSLASGDFNGDSFNDLAIGVWGERINSFSDAGAVNVLYGSSGAGLTATGDQLWDQGSSGLSGRNEAPAAADLTGTDFSTALHTAYPNPFIKNTTIAYDVSEAGRLRITLCDLLGHEVMVLVDDHPERGQYTAVIDGSNLQSGVYFVRMNTAGGLNQTLRVMCIK